MENTLTHEDYKVLRKPFHPSEVEFLRKYIYIREQAVNFRLTIVDPAWQYVITSMEYRADTHVVVAGYMILKGVQRFAIGEQLNEPSREGVIRYVDCAKGAETDLLKRLARKFMVGLYLTELPNNIDNIEAYREWYDLQKSSEGK
jgi:hypothetical protein